MIGLRTIAVVAAVFLLAGSFHYDCKESLIRQGEQAPRRPQTICPQTAPLNLVPEIAIVLALNYPPRAATGAFLR